MINSLKPLVKTSFFILLWMSWLRLVLFFYNIYPDHGFHQDLAASLFTGARFDLLVLGFAWIPVFVFYWIFYFLGGLAKASKGFKSYFLFLILLISLLSVLDLFWFHSKGMRLNYLALSEDGFWAVADKAADFRLVSAIPLMLLPGLIIFLTTLWKLNIADTEPSARVSEKVMLNLVLSFIVVASAARGTWTAHHLEWAHAQVSNLKLLNELSINPLWNLDKK
jgi:hypothetical protein